MKTIDSILIVLTLASAAAAQQSVADAARQARAQNHPGTAIVRLDGDSTARLATTSSENAPADTKTADTKAPDAKTADTQTGDAKSADAKTADAKTAGGKDSKGKPADDTKQKGEEWTRKIEAQKK